MLSIFRRTATASLLIRSAVVLQQRGFTAPPKGSGAYPVSNTETHTYVGRGGSTIFIEEEMLTEEEKQRNEELRYEAKTAHIQDPIWAMQSHSQRERKSTTKAGGKDDFDAATLKQWMPIKDAARMLHIREEKLFALKPSEVEVEWAKQYQAARTDTERKSITAAAETLVEYCASEFARDATRAHFAQYLDKTRREIEDIVNKERQERIDKGFEFFGFGHLFVTTLFVTTGVILYKFMLVDDASRIYESARRKMVVLFSSPANEEPAPDYFTRYRDTPTSSDIHAKVERPDITDPAFRRVLEERQEMEAKETQLLRALEIEEQDVQRRRAAHDAEQERRRAAGLPVVPTLTREEQRRVALEEFKEIERSIPLLDRVVDQVSTINTHFASPLQRRFGTPEKETVE
jgi:hypothetical protein